jgi:hypothetical protein
MPLPGSWITYLFKNKFKASNTLFNSAEYTLTMKEYFNSLPKNPAWNQQQSVTLSSKVVVYMYFPAERVEPSCLSEEDLQSPGIDSSESIPRNRFLGSFNVYKFGLSTFPHLTATFFR